MAIPGILVCWPRQELYLLFILKHIQSECIYILAYTQLSVTVSYATAFFASTMYTFWEEGGTKLVCALKGCLLYAPDGQGHAEASPWPTPSGRLGESKSSPYSAVPQESWAVKVVSAHSKELTLLWAGQRGGLLPIQDPQPNPAGPQAAASEQSPCLLPGFPTPGDTRTVAMKKGKCWQSCQNCHSRQAAKDPQVQTGCWDGRSGFYTHTHTHAHLSQGPFTLKSEEAQGSLAPSFH